MEPLCAAIGASEEKSGPLGVGPCRGFTLLEVLLSLALIALLATVLITGASHLMSDQPVTANDVFVQAVQEARKAALRTEHEIRLRYDKEKRQFLLFDGVAADTKSADGFVTEEKPRKQFTVPPTAGSDLAVDFLPPAVTKGFGPAILVGGVLIETRQMKSVTFYPDGTCSPFRVQFVRNGGSSIVSIDPWTCAPVLVADPNAPLRY